MSACDHDDHEHREDTSRIGKSFWRSKEQAIKQAVKDKVFGYDSHEEFTKLIDHGATPGPGHVDTLNSFVYDGKLMGLFAKGIVSSPRRGNHEDLPFAARRQQKLRSEVAAPPEADRVTSRTC